MQVAVPIQRGPANSGTSPEAPSPSPSTGPRIDPQRVLHASGSSRKLFENGGLDNVGSPKSEVAKLEKELQEKNQQLESERGELARQQALIKYAAGEARKEVLSLREGKRQGDEQLAAANTRIADLEGVMQGLNARIRDLEGRLRSPAGPEPSASNSKDSAHADDAQTAGGEAAEGSSVSAESVRQLEQQLADKDAEMAGLRADVAALDQALKQAPETMRAELDKLQAALEGESADAAALRRRVDEVTAERDEAAAAAAADVLRLEADLASRREHTARLEEELVKTRAAAPTQASQEGLQEVRQLQAALAATAAEAALLRAELHVERSANDAAAVSRGGRPFWERMRFRRPDAH